MINEKAAREFAKANGLTVGKRVKHADGKQTVQVGTVEVRHDNNGGKGCWYFASDSYVVAGETRHRHDYIGMTIRKAVLSQVQS